MIGTMTGRRFVAALTKRPTARRAPRSARGNIAAFGQYVLDRLAGFGSCPALQVETFGVSRPAATLDHRSENDLPIVEIDLGDDRHEPGLPHEQTFLENSLGHRIAAAVHVDVGARNVAVLAHSLVGQQHLIAVGDNEDIRGGHAAIGARSAWARRCSYSPWTGMNNSGLATAWSARSSWRFP